MQSVISNDSEFEKLVTEIDEVKEIDSIIMLSS